ncbi:MAG TPA: DNA polymerase ligase N-terminal domain-containing protein [Conexibacter sp.]
MAERFVLLQRDGARLDWRLELEHGDARVAWTLPRGAPLDPHDERVAIRAADAPLARHEPHDGERLDAGTYETHEWSERKVELTLHGARLAGRYGLHPIRGDAWIVHRLDPPSDPQRVPLPAHMAPMLARADAEGGVPADDERWGYEVKWDGIRALLWSDHGHVRIESRTQREIAARYPELRALGRALGAHELLLDGEIVALDADGRPSFERLASRMNAEGDRAIARAAGGQPVTYSFARRVATSLARRMPAVRVDWSANDPAVATLAPYALCAAPSPVVSTPLAWEELRALHAAGAVGGLAFAPTAVLARVTEHGDPFAPLLSVRQRLPSV